MKRAFLCACRGVRQVLDLADIPAEWRAQRFQVPRLVLFSIFTICGMMLTLNAVLFDTDAELTLPNALMTITSLFYVAACKYVLLRPEILEVLEVILHGLAIVVSAHGSLETPSEAIRHRILVYTFCMAMNIPILLGMRFKVFAVCWLMNLVTQVLATYMVQIRYQERSYPIMYSGLVVISLANMLFHYLISVLFRRLYDSEIRFQIQRESSESLISMFCDATCFLGEDANTILRCDQRFESMMGRKMVGEQFSKCVPQGSEEQTRLERVFNAAPVGEAPAPVTSFPTKLITKNGGRCVVDLYVVGHRLDAKSHWSAKVAPGNFLIGICLRENEDFAPTKANSFTQESTSDTLWDAQPIYADPPEINMTRDCPSELASLPATNASTQIFHVEGRLESTLDQIFNLGRREYWSIEKSEVSIYPDQVLGQGCFGVVAAGAFYGTKVAVKVALEVDQDLQDTCNELRIMRHLRHPNLVFLHGAVLDFEDKSIGLVLEYVNGGLHDFVLNSSKAQPPVLQKILLGISSALWYLHSRSPLVVHGDLKSENVLVERSGNRFQAKLADFGLSRLVRTGSGSTQALGGTLRYMAPEVFRKKNFKPAASSDVFSFGRLAFFVTTKRIPLNGYMADEVKRDLWADVVTPLDWEQAPLLGQQFRPMAEECLKAQSMLRPTMKKVHKVISSWCSEPEEHSFDSGQAAKTSIKDEKEEALDWDTGLQAIKEGGKSAVHRRPKMQLEGLAEENAKAGMSRGVLFPKLVATSDEARRATLRQVMTLWNFDVSSTACCSYHAGLQTLAAACVELQMAPCDTELLGSSMQDDSASMQCGTCGVLGVNDRNGCAFCKGYRSHDSRSPDSSLETEEDEGTGRQDALHVSL